MREREFKAYLESHLTERSAASYVSVCNRVERTLGLDLDDEDLSPPGLRAVENGLAAEGINASSLASCLTAVRRYRDFIAGQGHARETPRIRRNNALGEVDRRVETLSAADVLAQATLQMEVDLVELVARCSVWADPKVVVTLRTQHPHAAWYPDTRRKRVGETRGELIDGIRLDDNSWANVAIKQAIFGGRRPEGFHTCHVWPATCYDARYHTSIANLVLIPAPLAGLSDHEASVAAALRYRAFELYGWHPDEEPEPARPAHYPAADVWRPAPPITAAVRSALARRISQGLL